jgi:hypothetical protein
MVSSYPQDGCRVNKRSKRMNERIKELAEQATTITMDPFGEYVLEIDFDQEKFAELIVKECADTAYQSLYEDRVFDDVPANIRRNVMDAIKQHFGVEE